MYDCEKNDQKQSDYQLDFPNGTSSIGHSFLLYQIITLLLTRIKQKIPMKKKCVKVDKEKLDDRDFIYTKMGNFM